MLYCKFDFCTDLFGAADCPTGGKHLENDARFIGSPNCCAHCIPVFACIDFAEGRVAELLRELLLSAVEVIESCHVVVKVPRFVFGNVQESRVMHR